MMCFTLYLSHCLSASASASVQEMKQRREEKLCLAIDLPTEVIQRDYLFVYLLSLLNSNQIELN